MAAGHDKDPDIEILSWQPSYAGDFERLNIEWLERYFYVEPVDRSILADPENSIISHGGEVLFARAAGEIVGTVALKHQGGQRFELTKMAVTREWQGRGIGRRLAVAALRRYEERGGCYLYLESHSSLTTALGLYESIGFRHTPRPGGPSVYARADVYMSYLPHSG